MNKAGIILILFTVFLSSCVNSKHDKIVEVTSEEMETLLELEDVQLVDVRTPEEYEEGYIANAQNIDYYSDTFESDLLKLDKTKPVIVYCKSGRRSANCAEKLIEAGFVKVYDLDGGISEWQHKDKPITTN
ncbi:thioredoxin [Mangrovimonas yunxiaonensis]|uniref:Thioredoxin n=1 Tax=Mangrovimonas yunxiaonensis TaxID=1197477 RepID=A0A084TNV5_9FLAO|nr:rhodanese-like domain-containing protein [Mangrovimonas yunxiaonensis]KFB02391.1 thioredoxin [Mangrovimonas yunxiaonensis]MBR9756687.1 rhodanese-like domain-containing protein [Algicola sp.]GGH40051.1 hypothetical protein GCM10011364_09890 [Mangrovimonas yunxiaonensis]